MVGRKILMLLIGAALIAGTVPGAMAQESPATPSGSPGAEEVVFTTGTTFPIETANPFNQVWAVESWVTDLMYGSLLRSSQKDYSIEPELAESYEVSEDGLTWTFKIRPGLEWSDGEPLTANDFEFTANMVMEYNVGSSGDNYKTTESIEATDDLTLVWKTKEPNWIPGTYGITPYPEHIWGEFDSAAEIKDFSNFPDGVGSGPFLLTEWEKGQYWRMDANPNFQGEKPNVDSIIFRIFQSDEALVQALIRGTVDHISVPTAALFETVQNADGVSTAVVRPEVYTNFNFNLVENDITTAHPAVHDPEFRRAVSYAIDRNALVDRVLLGYGEPGTSPIPPVYPKIHLPPTEDAAVTFDPEEAKRILDEAGYLDTDGDGIREMPDGGRPLKLRLAMDSTDTDAIAADPFITSWLEDVGIEVTSRTYGEGRFYEIWSTTYDWDMLIGGWITDYTGDTQVWSYTTGTCPIQWSDTCYSNEEFDELYDRSLTETQVDGEARRDLLIRMQEILYEDNPSLILWYPTLFEAWRGDRWENFRPWPEPDGVIFDSNPYSAMTVQPIGTGEATGGSSGGGSGWIWWVIAGAVVVVGGGLLVLRSRKKSSSEFY